MEAAIYAHATSELNLAEVRKSSGVSLSHIANTTRISMRFLEAIEAEEFGKLPGGVFAINYVKQYARCIGIDEALLVDRCKRSLDPAPAVADLAPIIDAAAPAKPRSPGLWRLPALRIRIVWTSRRRNGAEARTGASQPALSLDDAHRP